VTPCAVRNLGRIGYRDAFALQRELVRSRIAGESGDTLLLVEHPPVITLGKMSKAEHVLSDGVEVVETDRGGDVTYHGPGQVVAYPIIRLDRQDAKWYVERLEEVMIRAVARYGIAAARAPGFSGAWVGDAKIGAIGVRLERWVASHGLALNVNTDLAQFDRIVPCGLRGKRVTSVASLLGHTVDFHEAQGEVARAFGEVLERELRPE
jgi:lipoyl(octanoyl) transferase